MSRRKDVFFGKFFVKDLYWSFHQRGSLKVEVKMIKQLWKIYMNLKLNPWILPKRKKSWIQLWEIKLDKILSLYVNKISGPETKIDEQKIFNIHGHKITGNYKLNVKLGNREYYQMIFGSKNNLEDKIKCFKKKTSWGWAGPSSGQLQTRAVSLTYCSCYCAQIHLMSLDFTRYHLMPLNAIWFYLIPIDSTWY